MKKNTKRAGAFVVMMSMLLSSANCFAEGKVWKVTRADVVREECLDYDTDRGNSLGVWSFYETAGFYPAGEVTSNGYLAEDGNYYKGSGIKYDEFKYGDVSDTNYYVPMTRIVPIQGDYYGIYITDHWTTGAPMQAPSINVTTNASHGMAHFFIDGPQNTYKKKGDVAVCFTVPQEGYYSIYHYFMNKGRGLAAGGDGILRRSIMKDGEVIEDEYNSKDFMFGSFTDGEPLAPVTEDTVSEYLKKGDKVYFRISSVTDRYNDDFWGKIKITNTDVNGNVIKIYDLIDLQMSQTDQWRFYQTPASNIKADTYTRLFVRDYSSQDRVMADLNDGTSQYIGAYSYIWETPRFNSSIISMPSITWFYNETGGRPTSDYEVTMEISTASKTIDLLSGKKYTSYDKTSTPIIGWVAPKDGYYKLEYRAKHVNNNGDSTAVIATYLPAGTEDDTNTVSVVDLENDTTTWKVAEPTVKYMRAGDRYMMRYIRDDEKAGKIYIKPTVTELFKFESDISVSDGVMTAVSEYNDVAGEVEGNQSVQFIYAVYKDNKIVGIFTSETKTLTTQYAGTGAVTTTYNLPSTEGKYTAVSYVWNSAEGMIPLADAIR